MIAVSHNHKYLSFHSILDPNYDNSATLDIGAHPLGQGRQLSIRLVLVARVVRTRLVGSADIPGRSGSVDTASLWHARPDKIRFLNKMS